MIGVDEALFGPLPAMIALARAYNAQVQGHVADTVKYAELAQQLIPEEDVFRRAQATVTAGVHALGERRSGSRPPGAGRLDE